MPYGRPGIYGRPYQTIPSSAKGYGSFLDQFYPDWRSAVKSGQPYPVQPGGAIYPGQPGYSSNGFLQKFGDFDPREIMNSEPYKRLVELSRGTGISARARQDVDPSMQYLRGVLGTANPLGTGRGDIVESRGLTALRTAGETARREAEESSSQYGRAADPESLSFVKGLLRMKEAEGMGGAIREGQDVALREREANESFRKAASDALSGLGLGLANTELQEGSLMTSAAQGAGQLESFARNIWAQVLSSLFGGRAGTSTRDLEDMGFGEGFESRELRKFLEYAGFGNYGYPELGN